MRGRVLRILASVALLAGVPSCATILLTGVINNTDPPALELAPPPLAPGRYAGEHKRGERVWRVFRFAGVLALDPDRVLEVAVSAGEGRGDCEAKEVDGPGETVEDAFLVIGLEPESGADSAWVELLGSESPVAHRGDPWLVRLDVVPVLIDGQMVRVTAGRRSALARGEGWTGEYADLDVRWVRRSAWPHHLLYGLYPAAVTFDILTLPFVGPYVLFGLAAEG